MAVKKKAGTAAQVLPIAKRLAEKLGLELWDVLYEKEGAVYYLKVLIDKPGGVSMDDCEALTRPLSKALDDADPIKESYILEVGSPGLGRKLRLPEHFRQFLGCPVHIRLIRSEDGEKEFIAVLTAYDEENNSITVVTEDDSEMIVSLAKTAYVKLCDDMDLSVYDDAADSADNDDDDDDDDEYCFGSDDDE